MRIVSLNAWGGTMFAELAQWLPGIGADVMCLQEVTRTPALSGATHFDDGERALPQRANLFDDLRALLPRHQGMFVASDSGPVRDSEGHRHQQDFGLATFVDEHVPMIGHAASLLHGTFVDHHTWASVDRPRTAQAVRLVHRAADRIVTVVQLHGLRDPQGKGDTSARREQAKRLADLVGHVREPNDLTVVCGDLNLLPDSETFDILREVGLVDLVGATDTRTSRYVKPVRHASYLLVSDPTVVTHFEVVEAPEVSDHRALLLDV